MSTQIYGVLAAECPDRAGETLLIRNCDTSNLRYLNSEHESAIRSIMGSVDFHKKIYSEQDCKTDQERRCWNLSKCPILFIKGTLADDEGHPEAIAAASLLRFKAKRPDTPLPLGLSVEGGIAKKTDANGKENEEGKILAETVATGGSFTVKPANPKCVLFLENDLQKSTWSDEPPDCYFDAMKRAGQLHSFREVPYVKIDLMARRLKKSIEDYNSAHTNIRCPLCKSNYRFFKSTKDMPNSCKECGNQFNFRDIWKALNK